MNELPTRRVEFQADDPNAQRLIDAALKGLAFEWEGALWNVYRLNSWDHLTAADLQLAATVEYVDPPAWCSCGKPAVRGGLCATEPAPELDVTRILLDIIPGDGDGHEVYAKSVADVEAKLAADGEHIEDLELKLYAARARVAELEQCLYQMQEAAKSLSAPVAQAGQVPEGVRAWFEAKLAHVNAVDAYNARLKFVREHCPFGTSIDPEYQLMEDADRKARSLVGPMFDELRALLNGESA